MNVVDDGEKIHISSFDKTIRDANEDICSGILILSNLHGLQFDSNNGIVKIQQIEPTKTLLYLSPGERVIRIFKSGYQPLKIILMEYGIKNLESGKVWQLKIEGEEKKQKDVTILIKTTPAESKIFIDNEDKGVTNLLRIPIGKHILRVEKIGFEPVEKEIYVNNENIEFNITLEETDPILITFQTVPEEATIFLNDEPKGKTNRKLLLFPCTYQIKLIHPTDQNKIIIEQIHISKNGKKILKYSF